VWQSLCQFGQQYRHTAMVNHKVLFSRSGEILEIASGISLCDLQPFCR